MIKKIIIHKNILDSFKRKACKAMPHEIIAAILGKIEKDVLHICALDDIEVEVSVVRTRSKYLKYGQPEEEMEAGTNLKYYGTLHTHPNMTVDPSDDDKKDFLEKFNAEEYSSDGCSWEYLPDEIMGILSLVKKKKVMQYTLVFYNIDFTQIQVTTAEDKKKKAKNVNKSRRLR